MSNLWTCDFASNVIGLDVDSCGVTVQTCDACCRHLLPSGPELNPVIASVVYSEADRLQKSYSPSAVEQVDIHQARQFAIRWLATVDSNGDRIAPQIDRTESRETALTNASPATGGMNIGLVGAHSGWGLAQLNRDIADHLRIDRWLVHGRLDSTSPQPPCRTDSMQRPMSDLEMEAWLDGLDAVIFSERPGFSNLTRVARSNGVMVICIPMWEWLQPALDWLPDVDLMLCPTQHTFEMMNVWKKRFGFQWNTSFVPWPVNVERFAFRVRHICKRFVFVNGSGGYRAQTCESNGHSIRRKGLELLLQAAELVPEIPIVVYAFSQDVPAHSANVDLRPPPESNELLYSDGDVCVQPGHWEGLGLPLLECQAAGMPLITTNAAPMNEHHPLAVVRAQLQTVQLTPELRIPAAGIQPEDLATVLRTYFGRPIGSWSRRARRFVEREHSWNVAGPKLQQHIEQVIRNKS